MFRITPKPGLVIPGLDGRPLPEDGLVVGEVGPFWRRRLADGDVTITSEAEADTAATSAKRKA